MIINITLQPLALYQTTVSTFITSLIHFLVHFMTEWISPEGDSNYGLSLLFTSPYRPIPFVGWIMAKLPVRTVCKVFVFLFRAKKLSKISALEIMHFSSF